MRILKFGGTSVGDTARLRQVAGIVATAAAQDEVVVVVSAQAGVTDALVAATDRGHRNHLVDELTRRNHRGLETLGGPVRAAATAEVQRRLAELEAHLEGAPSNGERPAWRDAVLATGERLSVQLVAAALAAAGLHARAVDARELIVTDSGFGEATVDLPATRRRVAVWRRTLQPGTVPVVTGFIGADPAGRTTTLGRGGSDYSAALLGAALGADRIEIWTDVDGVLTAPPRIVPAAVTVPALSFGVAREVAMLGGKVLHPKTMQPAEAAGIPIVVRCTFAPERPGTVVQPAGWKTAYARVVTGLDGVALLAATQATSRQAGASWSAGLEEAGIAVLGLGEAGAGRAAVAVPVRDIQRAAGVVASLAGWDDLERRDDLCLVALAGDDIAAGHQGEARLRHLLDGLHLPALAVLRRASPDSVVAALRSHFLRRAITALHEVVVGDDSWDHGEPWPLVRHAWEHASLVWQGGRP